jgi:hypothetical protein
MTHRWYPISSDCTEWECENCKVQIDNPGAPCRHMPIELKIGDGKMSFSCDELSNGMFEVIEVQES